MRRVYTSIAHFRAPYDTPNVSFAGLGTLGGPSVIGSHSAYDRNKWPAGRSYWSTNFYRAPYQQGYYQSGALRGDEASMTGLQKFGMIAAVIATIAVGVLSDRAAAKRGRR